MNVFSFIRQHPVLILLIYLVVINLALFLTMGIDKRRARREKRRIPEARLFLMAILGGSPGGIAGMYAFRHKTKHSSFVIGFPAIFIIELALALFIILR